jgi:pyruvate dehydrogenase E2 component (dihydrolipoamide acetyltransferase)
MPQMGESIFEGTLTKWLKKPGDKVNRDEPLFEISTDKVDAEIPSPGAGVLLEIKVKEGETVPVNSVVAVIGAAGEKGAAAPAASASAPAAAANAAAASADRAPDGDGRSLHSPAATTASAAVKDVEMGSVPAADEVSPKPGETQPAKADTLESLRRTRSSPLVRKIAKEHNVDITQLNGTGISGRVTKKDITAFIEAGPPSSSATARPAAFEASGASPKLEAKAGENVRIEKMGVMRKKIADHMVMSIHTSPHVYSAYEVDFSRIEKLRLAKKREFEAAGTRLTYTGFIAKATVDTIRQFPFSNASIDGDNIVYKRDVNLGIAVALETGLIVPVIRNADERNLLGISRAIQDLAHRARNKQLKPEEVQGGTFTITNPGIFGALFGLPIISQPQVAILGVGSVDKRAVVIDDMIAIRPMCYLTLGYDHRLIDGADAGRFLVALKDRLQNFDEAWM